jgi:hypothetical protein
MLPSNHFLLLLILFANVALAQTNFNNIKPENLPVQEKQNEDFYLSIKSTKPIPFYQKASTKSAVIMNLPPNAVAIQYIGCKDLRDAKNLYFKSTQGKMLGWCKIIHRGVYGWVQRQFLQKYIVEEDEDIICDDKVGEIDAFICEDYELRSLAKQLIQVYKHAEQKAKISSRITKNHLRELNKSQSSWQLSREKCLKGDYYEKQDCLLESYKIRITYLQAKWLLAGNAPSISYQCGGKHFIITKFLTDLLPSVMVQDNKQRLVMIDYIADTENRYFGDDGAFYYEIANGIGLKWLGTKNAVSCKAI